MSEVKIDKVDFFISYANSDSKVAEWIAWHLEENNYKVVFQKSEAPQDNNLAKELKSALEQADKMIAVISGDYFKSKFSKSDWAKALSNETSEMHNKLIPVRVEKFDVRDLEKPRVYIDIVDCEEDDAKRLILDGIEGKHVRPSKPPTFPLSKESSVNKAPPVAPTYTPKPQPKPTRDPASTKKSQLPPQKTSYFYNCFLVFVSFITPILCFMMMVGLQMSKAGMTTANELLVALAISGIPILFIGGIPISRLRIANKSDVSVFVWGYYIAYILLFPLLYPAFFQLSCLASYYLDYTGCPIM